MLALLFICIAMFDWFLIKSKSKVEKWGGLLLILLIAAWNVSANFILWWADPFVMINMALGWIQ